MTGGRDSRLLSFEQAQARIAQRLAPLAALERVPLERARGRVLAEPVVAAIDVPPFRNAAMDGYAVDTSALPAGETHCRLILAGTAYAGRPYRGPVGAGRCVRIMTGAPVPPECDAVVMQENVTADGDGIGIPRPVRPGQNVRDAGEDLRRGETVLAAGRRLTPADLGVLASLGTREVEVTRPLRVRYYTSGDELREPGEPLAEGQLYDSNRYALAGLLDRPGIDAGYGGNLPDRPEPLAEEFARAAKQADVLITCGGVSVGEADHITAVLAERGEVEFSKVAMKPGKPLNFGRLGGAWFFGLPGNPVSAMVTFLVLVQPALRRLAGEYAVDAPLACPARLGAPVRKRPGRYEFQRGRVSRDASGGLTVSPADNQGSHRLSSMSRANCFIALPADTADLNAGEAVDIIPFGELT